MIQPHYFTETGWRSFNQSGHPLHPSAHALHQRPQKDSDGQTLFFWNVWEYPDRRIASHVIGEEWLLEVSFHSLSDAPPWKISASVQTPQELEDAMGRIMTFWQAHEWKPYDAD